MYPRALSYFVNKISNYSTNVVKLTPYRTDNITPGQIITVELPSNALVDLRTLTAAFKLSTSASGGTNNFATINQNSESLIEKIGIEINGQTLHSCANLNYVYSALVPLTAGTDMKNKRAVYSAGGDVVDPTANLNNEAFVWQHWLGFLGSVQPDVIDTSLLGTVKINITLANANCLVKAATAGPTSASYSISNLYFHVSTLAIDDGIYYPLHETALKAGMVYELPFDNWMTSLFSASTMNQSSRFGISSQSVDLLLATFPSNYNVLSAVNPVSGRGAQFDTVGTGCTSFKFTVNNTQYPMFTSDVDDSFPLLLNSLNATQDVTNGISPLITKSAWKSAFCVFAQSLELGTSADERIISGKNTLGTNSQISFESLGNTTVNYCLVMAKCSSVLRVSSGRNIELVM